MSGMRPDTIWKVTIEIFFQHILVLFNLIFQKTTYIKQTFNFIFA